MPAAVTRSSRLTALDGLRGIAALVVLFHHAALLSPAWPGNVAAQDLQLGSIEWWLNATPLKALTAGAEAVVVFFVLSGFVVALPVLKARDAGRQFDWTNYFPRRTVRLVLPVLASALVAAFWVALLPQVSDQEPGTWLSNSSTPALQWELIVAAGDLFGGDGQINNPLWTLRWEVLFSLALPIMVGLALLVRRWWALALLLALGATWLGVRTGAGSAEYLSAFFMGTLLAVRADELQRFTVSLTAGRWGGAKSAALMLSALLLLLAPWLAASATSSLPELRPALRALAPLGAVLLVVAALTSRTAGALLDSRPVQLLGRLSFSLYLVHVPIVLFSYYALRGNPLIVAQVTAVAVSLPVAWAFWWAVERPSQRLARRVGRMFSDQLAGERVGGR